MRYLPFLDLRGYRPEWFGRDLVASLAPIFVGVPQGLAYAIIAGLPPAVGLYAAAFPAIVGSLCRSSRHVVTGPTNALSLLVGTLVAVQAATLGASPIEIGVTLACLVGVFQLVGGLLRLDMVVDYISTPVLRGYITGAGVLIAIGQLPNLTGTARSTGNAARMLEVWVSDLHHTDPITVAFALGTVLLVVGFRRIDRRIPGALIAMAGGILAVMLFDLRQQGLRVVADIAPTPAGLPPLTIPMVDAMAALVPGAIACTVLSLVESSSVARAIAGRSGQHLDMAAEFTGQGLANLAAAFSGGYPVSGSLTRSLLIEQAGARSRLAGAISGVLMLLVLFVLGPLVDQTPIASLAGLLLVIAADLIDVPRISITIRGTGSDRVAFLATLLGTWILDLDKAIYLGVGISLVLFLRRARLLTMRELAVSEKGRFQEIEPQTGEARRSCSAIRVMNVTGPLFFAVAGELESALRLIISDRKARVLILRMRQAQGLDVTIAGALEATSRELASEGRTLLLVGLRRPALDLLQQTGIADRLGTKNLFPVEAEWFASMEAALRRALDLVGRHQCGEHCPLAEYVALQNGLRSMTPASADRTEEE